MLLHSMQLVTDLNLIDILLKQVNLVGAGTVSGFSVFFLGTALQI